MFFMEKNIFLIGRTFGFPSHKMSQQLNFILLSSCVKLKRLQNLACPLLYY